MMGKKSLCIYLSLLLLGLLSGCSGKKEKAPAEELLPELRKIEKLTLAEAKVQKVVILKDPEIHFREVHSFSGAVRWAEEKLKPGVRTAVFSFDSALSAYIDLQKLTLEDVVQDNHRKHCTLRLPAIELELLGRDFTMETRYQRVTAYRSPITPEERAKLKNRAYARLQKEVMENSDMRDRITRQAEQKAIAWFTQLLALKGWTASVSFVKPEDQSTETTQTQKP